MKAVHWLAVGVTWMCFVVGVGLLACCFGFYHHSQTFLAMCARADGMVVENVPSRDSNNDTVYCPRFSFQTPDGATHTRLSSAGSSPPAYSAGQHVQVLYMPSDPDDAKLNSFTELWFGATIFFVLGAAGCIGGIIWLLVDRLYVIPRLPKKAS